MMSLCPGPTARQSVSSCIRRRKRLRAASTASIPITSSMRSRRGRSRLRTADGNGRRSAIRARASWEYGRLPDVPDIYSNCLNCNVSLLQLCAREIETLGCHQTVTKIGVKQPKVNELQKTGILLSDGWQRDLVESCIR